MISFVGTQPSDDEITAILTALQTLDVTAAAPPQTPTSAWALAMRHDELDYDDLRALVAQR
ncbi:MAG TPA: hypothetical protein VMS32_02580 [Verrucomicrobiae bacterium]|jgi:hypothetical protein|nr:hypothetical protein [Verrucomicrobiae bacterium]